MRVADSSSMPRSRRSASLVAIATQGTACWACCSSCRSSALLQVFARERQVRIDHALELSSAYRGTAMLLGDVIEADDEYTGTHSRDVVELVVAVADRLGLDPSSASARSSPRCCTTSAR